MIDKLEKIFKDKPILVADGAMGTMLFEKGLQIGQCPEIINLTKPEILQDIALSYFNAGADIIQTNTFGASPLKLSNYGLEEKTEQINRAAVKAVKNVVNEKAYISASCGPCGKILKPYGDTDPELVYKNFYKQMVALIDEGVDFICIETMTDINEAKIAIKAAKDISKSTPVIATMTFDLTPRGFYTIMGVNINQACSELEKIGADIIGSNCGNGIENMIKIAVEFKKHSSLPLIMQPNAGLPVTKNNQLIYAETPQFFENMVPLLLDAGVSIIGGCCGTTPDHIKSIRQIVDAKKKTN